MQHEKEIIYIDNLEDLSRYITNNKNNKQIISILPAIVWDNIKPLNLLKDETKIFKQLSSFFTLFKDYIDTPISRTLWEEYFSRHTYKIIKDTLLNNNLINWQRKEGKKYLAGSHPTHYRITANVKHCKSYYIYIKNFKRPNYSIINIKDDNIKDDNIITNQPEINCLLNEYIDLPKAIKAEIEYFYKNKSNIFLRLNRIINFNSNANRRVSRPKSNGRIYTPICTISRVSRRYLSRKYNTIDLKNSQPLMLVFYCLEKGLDIDKEYVELTSKGKIYDVFYHLYNNDRNKVKELFFKNIYYGFNKTQAINKKFKEMFPLVWEILNKANDEKQYGISLAADLQAIEASIFLPITTKHSTMVYKIHDSISFNNKKDKAFILKQLKENTKKYGINVPISYEESQQEVKIIL